MPRVISLCPCMIRIVHQPGSKHTCRGEHHHAQRSTHHQISRRIALTTHKHNRTPQPSSQQDAHITSRPQKQEQSNPAQAHFAGRTKSVYGLARWETAQTPLPEHTHASQNHSRSQPQQIGGTEQMEAHLGLSLVDAVHADFRKCSEFSC
jgi:hypothetical protein